MPVTATVVDAQGRLVRGLTREDFQVFEDGVEQPVTQFTDERVPVSLGLLLDASDSMRGRPMVDASAAVEHFVGDLLEGGGRSFHRALQPPAAAGGVVDAPGLGAEAASGHGAGGRRHGHLRRGGAGRPVLRQARAAAGGAGRISDGADTASDRTLQQAREAVVRRDAFVYAVAIDEVGALASTRVNPAALSDLTSPTGGYTEVVRSAVDLGPATARIADELNSQYTIGFNPAKAPDGSWRAHPRAREARRADGAVAPRLRGRVRRPFDSCTLAFRRVRGFRALPP